MTRRARATDPLTSVLATYQDIGDEPLRIIIYTALMHGGPMTHDQLIETVRVFRPASDSGVRTRTRELVDAGEVERVPDMVAKSRYGRASLLWQVVK